MNVLCEKFCVTLANCILLAYDSIQDSPLVVCNMTTYCELCGQIKGIFHAIYCIIVQHSITFILNGHYRRKQNLIIQHDSRNTITRGMCRYRSASPFRVPYTKRHSRLHQHLGKTRDPPFGTLSSLLLFQLSTQLCRLWSAHSFEDFVFSETTPFAAYRKSSSLIRGPNRCGGFCACVAGLFNVSDSFFSGGQPFSSADSSLFMGLRSLQKHGW